MRFAPLIVAAIALIHSGPGWALDGAPYTNEAMQRLTRASNSVEQPRPSQDSSVFLKRRVAMYRELYAKAGYSFEKSMIRFLTELAEDGIPPMVPQAQVINQAYVELFEARSQGAKLDQAFDPAVAANISALMDRVDEVDRRQKEAKKAADQRERDEMRAQADARAANAAEARQARERDALAKVEAVAKEWGGSIGGRYAPRSGRDPSFMMLSYVEGRDFRISGEQRYTAGKSVSVCSLPETVVSMNSASGSNRLSGDGNADGCQFRLEIEKSGTLYFTPKAGGCSASCSSGSWRGGSFALSATPAEGEVVSSPTSSPAKTSPDKTVNDILRALHR